jgi:SpoVK/Ycf46/Vps4 family AAA+-type ATPase
VFRDHLAAPTGQALARPVGVQDGDTLAKLGIAIADGAFDLVLTGSGKDDAAQPGINILIYGPPVTGKTEFCKVLAAYLGTELFLVGEVDENGQEPDRGERIDQLRLAQQVLSRRDNAVLLFDEMEDLLGSVHSRVSKIFTNRLLEQARVPTLWTCNDLDSFDPALLRRMTLAIEMGTPSPQVRERVWRRSLAGCPITISDADLRSLAREPNASPALAANAVKAARLAGGGAERLRLSVASIAKAMRGGLEVAVPVRGAHAFDLALVNADIDLLRLGDRLARSGAPRNVSLCLSGPPGTGKSAYVRHLAERLGMEVLEKRASDLFGMYVGESEKNIALAFAEAMKQQAFLIFDEADSLLSDRLLAHHGWEVSQVNEMLTWMERHPLPFACTTNLMQRLEPRALGHGNGRNRHRGSGRDSPA